MRPARVPPVSLPSPHAGRRALARLLATTVLAGAAALPSRAVGQPGTAAPDTARPPAAFTLRGVVWDSLAGAPLVDALVQFVPVGDLAAARTTRTDSLGRWRLDTLPAGEHLGAFFHPALEALGLEAPTFRVRVGVDPMATLDFGIPGAARLRRVLCGEAARSDSTGVVLGVLRDAETHEPLAGATLTVAWRELQVGGGGARWVPRRVPVRAGATGTFVACGVPIDAAVALDAEAPGRTSGVVDVRVPVGGVLRQDLRLGESGAHSEGAPASRSRGTAVLRGVVTEANGRPVPGAQVLVVGQAREARTGTAGAFVVDSLAGGTHTIEVRAIGFAPVRRAVELRRATSTELPVRLTERVAALERVTVTGERRRAPSVLDEYEDRRRRNSGGHFVGPEQLARMALTRTSDALRATPGVKLRQGRGAGGIWRQEIGLRGGCAPAVFVDGIVSDSGYKYVDLLLPPHAIHAIEVHTAATAPPQYGGLHANGCGVVLLWTRRGGGSDPGE